MATVRFVHTGDLRLGSAVCGLQGCPDWLKKQAARAVRQSVSNAIQKTASVDADFLLISGSVAASGDDLPAALQWLNQQFAELRQQGIRLIAIADDAATRQQLSSVFDIVLSPTQRLQVSRTGTSRAELQIHEQQNQPATNLLTVGALPQQFPSNEPFAYWVAKPSGDQAAPFTSSRCHVVAANPLQAVTPSETFTGCCQIVEADLNSQSLAARSFETDVLRFARRHLALPGHSSPDQLVESIARASEEDIASAGHTLLVDWVVNGSLVASVASAEQWHESTLLNRTRQALQSGHKGIWPRTLRLTEPRISTSVQPGTAVATLLRLTSETVNGEAPDGESWKSYPLTPEVLTALQLLSRAA